MPSQCCFGGRRVAILCNDGRIVVREKDVNESIAVFQSHGTTSISMNDTGDYVAAGNESGVVIIWNVLSQQQNTLSSNISLPVTSVTFIESTLFSSQDGKLFQWENAKITQAIEFQKSATVTKMTKGPDKTIIAGSRQISRYSLKTGDEISNYSGHTTECSILIANNRYLLSAGTDEKSATVWNMDDNDNYCRFHLTRSAKYADINGKNVLILNSGTGSGHQIELVTISPRHKPIKSKKFLNITDEQGEEIEIFAARFIDHMGNEKNTLCDVIYGTAGSMKWEEIDINQQVNLERKVTSKTIPTFKKTDIKTETKIAARLTGESALRRKRMESINESEMTMAERLGLSGEEKDMKTGSIRNVLQQALHVRDKKQIGKILTYNDNTLIKETVKNIPPHLAPVLMTEISARLQCEPERALATSRWLRTTIQYHSAPLAAASHDVLETTRLPLQLRTVAFSRLKELQGKLELAIATAKLSDNESDEENDPMVVIDDLTDIEDHSHSESDWEAEFNNDKGFESGAESEVEQKRRKLET